MTSIQGSDLINTIKQSRPTVPQGKMPQLSAENDKVDWTLVAIQVRAFFKRYPGYQEALKEPQEVDPDNRQEQKLRLGEAYNNVYSLLVEMCTPNETAMLQVRNHSTSDPDECPNNLWKMLEARFTQERMNKIQGYLNEIGRVKYDGNEDFKIFIDQMLLQIFYPLN